MYPYVSWSRHLSFRSLSAHIVVDVQDPFSTHVRLQHLGWELEEKLERVPSLHSRLSRSRRLLASLPFLPVPVVSCLKPSRSRNLDLPLPFPAPAASSPSFSLPFAASASASALSFSRLICIRFSLSPRIFGRLHLLLVFTLCRRFQTSSYSMWWRQRARLRDSEPAWGCQPRGQDGVGRTRGEAISSIASMGLILWATFGCIGLWSRR